MADEMRDRAELAPLDDLDDLEIADGEPDPRGWDVIGADGNKIGEVDQLLVDRDAMKVRYLGVDVDDDLLASDRAKDEDEHLLIPVGYAELNEDDEKVIVPQISADQLRGRIIGQTDITTLTDTGRMEGRMGRENERLEGGARRIPLSEEELSVGKREVKAGEVDIHKTVETRHVEKPVTLNREEVDIRREPATGMRAGNADFGEGEIRIPLTEEEAVVQKRPVVREELVVRKREIPRTENVEADLRRERADIDREGRVRETDRHRDEDRS